MSKNNSSAKAGITEAATTPNSVPTDTAPQSVPADQSEGLTRHRAGFYQFAIDDPKGVFPPAGVSVPISEGEDLVRGDKQRVPMVIVPTVRLPRLRCARVDCPHRRKNNDRASEWYPEPPLRTLTLANSNNMQPEEPRDWEEKWAQRHAKSWLCPHCYEAGVYEKGNPVKASPMMPTPFKEVPMVRWLTEKEVARLEQNLDPDRKATFEYGTLVDSLGNKRQVRVGMVNGAIEITRAQADEFRGTRLKKRFPAGPLIKYSWISDDEEYKPYDPQAQAQRNASLEQKLRTALALDNGKLADVLKQAGVEV